MDLIDSNHGSMAFRKAKHHGIPSKYLKDYGDILEAPKGWVWHHDLSLPVSTGNQVYFHHGLSKDVMKVVNQRGTCVVQGHYHTEFRVGYSGNPASLLWGMNVGCSIDGKARLLPMTLDSDGRWNGQIP